MKFLVAPARFKGTFSAFKAAELIKDSLLSLFPQAEVDLMPLADGGVGTVETFLSSLPGKKMTFKATSPLGEKVEALVGVVEIEGEKVGIAEMAAASGLTLVPPEKRNPLLANTYGTGELIKNLAQAGVKKIILGLGDSATVDGGVGALEALGVLFLDKNNKRVEPIPLNIPKIVDFEDHIPPKIKEILLILATDVKNPLLGEKGAAKVYAPQKGAREDEVELLEEILDYWRSFLERKKGKKLRHLEGGGAAGGLGIGLSAFLNTQFESGSEIILKTIKAQERVEKSDFIVTGEGSFDEQSLFGKGVYSLIQLAQKYKKPLLLISGEIKVPEEKLKEIGVLKAVSLSELLGKERALKGAEADFKEGATKLFTEVLLRKEKR
jgi:glycerate kinase